MHEEGCGQEMVGSLGTGLSKSDPKFSPVLPSHLLHLLIGAVS